MIALTTATDASVPIAKGQPPRDVVKVTGGADESGHNYTWQITNQGNSPIVEVEFPHYRADLFFAPAHWTYDCTNLVNVGVKRPDGRCVAKAAGTEHAIRPGGVAVFQMRIAPVGAPRGTGTIRLRFADSSAVRLSGVELPSAPSFSDKYVSLIALAAIFLGYVAIKRWRSRRSTGSAATPHGAGG